MLCQLVVVIDYVWLFIGVDLVLMYMVVVFGILLVVLFGFLKLIFWCLWQVKGEVIWVGDFGLLFDLDVININIDECYFDLIFIDVVIVVVKKVLV